MSSVDDPGPEGWYPDPWNPSAQRYWTGSMWSGRTAALGVDPDASVPETQRDLGPLSPEVASSATASEPTFAVRKGPRDRSTQIVVGVGVLAVVLVLVVVIVASGGSSSNNQSLAGPPSPTTAAPASGPQAGVLTPADVGTGWSPQPTRALPASSYTDGPCHSPLWNGDLSGYQSSFVNGTNINAAHGAIVANFYQAASAAAATQQQTFVDSPPYVPCLKQQVVAEVESLFPPGSGQSVTGTSVNPFTMSLPVPTESYVVTVSEAGPGPTTEFLTDDSVVMFEGPYEATVDVSWTSLAPLTQEIVQTQAANEAQHLLSLPTSGLPTS